MRGREEVVLSKEMEGGVVAVVVDAKVEDELVVWGGGLKEKGVEPG